MLLFHASDAPWVSPFAGSADSTEKNNYVTDGPFLYRAENGELLMLWSSHGADGYAIGIARSAAGQITGSWKHESEPLFGKDGGHGMLFTTFNGAFMLTIHRPNHTPDENKDEVWEHRMYVLKNEAANPLEQTWAEKGQLQSNWESVALDATTFEHKGVRYLVWAQQDPQIKGNSNLYIAEMSNPWTISGKQVMLSKPEYQWETIGFGVNEGPAVLKKNGRIFISYSASATDDHYCMGLLTAWDTSDLLDPNSWTKSLEPVFKTNEETGQYGPGHRSRGYPGFMTDG